MRLPHRVTSSVLLPPRPPWLSPPSRGVYTRLHRIGVRAWFLGAHVPRQLPHSVTSKPHISPAERRNRRPSKQGTCPVVLATTGDALRVELEEIHVRDTVTDGVDPRHW
jgi:hypothetical protein